ncbi:MAG TPA: hypothetical protein PKA88_40030, partial [Polyangiaceae bacterium]|nr:hypothetical protein [Polyangiaceae bacterium]
LGANLSIRSYETSNGDTTIASGSTFALGLGVGAHIFATEDFSIDPAFSVYRVNGSEKVGDVEFGRGGWAFLASFSFSGWIGGSQTSMRRNAIDSEHRVDPATGSARASRGNASEGAAPQLAATPTRSDGLVSITIRLNGGTVTFAGKPESAPDQIAFRVRASTSGGRFKECQSLSVTADGEQYEAENLKYSERLGGTRVTEAMQGTLSLAAVAALGEADGSAVVRLCDLELAVGMPERGKVYDFFETFKGLEPGAWSPPSGVRLQRGRFTVDFRIKDHALRYEVRPRRSLDHVELRVTGAADSCRELKVLVDDRVHSEHELSPPGASGPSRSGGQ